MATLLQDLRFGARLLWKDKAFTVTSILTLAVCIGANAAIFCIVNSVLLKPLPFPEADRILLMYNAYPKAGAGRSAAGVPDYYDRLRETTVFEEQALFNERGQTIDGQGEAERLDSLQVTPSFFRLLRVKPWRGRTFTEDEGEIGREHKVMLAFGLWQRLYAGTDDAIGRDLRLNGVPHTIVGVLPPGFQFISPDTQLWIPAAFTPEQKSDNDRHSNSWTMIGRLKPGASLQQAQQQIDALNARNLERFPHFKQILIDVGFYTGVVRLQDDMVRDIARALYLLWAGALFVLLIGCVNIANLTLARSTARLKEIAVRHVLGAGLGRLARQMLTETAMLAAIGGALGVLTGYWALGLIRGLGLDRLPRAGEIRMDLAVIGYTFAIALAVGLFVGLVPLARLGRAKLSQAFREEGRTGTSGRTSRLVRRALVTAQVAFALLLLVGAGLLFASFRHVLAVDPGFVPDQVLTGTISPPAARYADDPALRSYADRALARIRALPGVVRAGATSSIPFGDSFSDSVIFPEGYVTRAGEALITVAQSTVSPEYLEAMGIRLVRGRFFTDADTESSVAVVVIDDRLARKFWPNQDPIGKRMFRPEDIENLTKVTEKTRFLTVVGVADTVRMQGLTGSDERFGAAYFAEAQDPARRLTFAIKTAGDPGGLVPALRRACLALDPQVPVYNVRSMRERMDASLMSRRTPMVLALVFGAVALFLAAVGLYGVLAYQVSERRREIGVRMALGGDRLSIFGLILREGMALVGIGAAAGLAAALAFGRALESQLYEVRPVDPPVLSLVVILLGLVAFVACVVPARRASRVDPVTALSDL